MARKRKRKGLGALAFIVIVAVLGLLYTVVSGDRPLLGLDLQGGVSVVLQPRDADVPAANLEQAKRIIDKRINALGVAESEVTIQGKTILVQIPGVKDKDRALKLVGQTAELQFRPVLQCWALVAESGTGCPEATSTDTGSTDTTDTTATGSTDTTASTVAPDSSTSTPTTASATSTSQQSMGALVEGESASGAQTDSTAVETTTTTVDPAASTTTTLDAAAVAAAAAQAQAQTQVPELTSEDVLNSDAGKAQTVVIPEVDRKTGDTLAVYQLGPVGVGGTSVESASAGLNSKGQWEIRPIFKDGADGIDKFNAAAAECNPPSANCPTGQIAVVLDNKVLTAPTIQVASFKRDEITISGNYKESEAKDIATALNYGALPVVLVPQTSEIVSATLGRDALHAGLVAGLVGFVLVGLYMIFFYRLLGLLAMFKLFIEGAILWAILCFLGAQWGLALTLAGITGIIVSIGVSLDSNVVYYEHMKEDVRSGRSIRAAVDKSFASAWSTILAADGASIIGAAVLWFFTVGAVRGFAFFLGLSTVLDLITSYCYMRPVVRWATNSKRCADHPHQFGLPDGPTEPPAATGRTAVAAGRTS
jgi:preprotein translocase subunit SecD